MMKFLFRLGISVHYWGKGKAAILAIAANEEDVHGEAGQATESGWNLVLGITFKCLIPSS